MYHAWITPLLNCLIGRQPLVRRHTLMCLASGQLYALIIGVTFHAAYLGLLQWGVAYVIAASMCISFLVFYSLIRSGWSQRFKDPVLTLAHALAAQSLTIMAYVLVGPGRGDVVLLMAQIIAVSMFRLRPRQTLSLGLWTVGGLSLAQLGLVLGGAEGFTRELALAHFCVSNAGLLALSLVAKWVSDIRVRIARHADELRLALNQAQVLATTDMLTGLLNRRSMIEHIESELTKAIRFGRPLCVALIDIDHFKRINDIFGHHSGDDVLRGFADMAQADLRDVDKLARWGGEEFLLLMPMVDQDQAWAAVDRLRQRTVDQPVAADGKRPLVSVSAGIAQWRRGEALSCWLERADKAMYDAKRQGRNRCVIARALTETAMSVGPRPSVAARPV